MSNVSADSTAVPYDSRTDPANVQRIVLENPLDKVALTSLALGTLIGSAIALLLFVSFKQILVYLVFLAAFHFLEYYVTAKYSYDKVSVDSFLIFNGLEYAVAHFVSVFETFVELWFFPRFKKSHPFVSIAGFVLVCVGQYLRSSAMATAGESFSHLVAHQKKKNHTLVTNGIYSYLRHPSYTGFVYWALGTQLLLCNPVSFCLFYVLLRRFFLGRIGYEESKLVQFFGNDYIQYRQKTGTGMPFV